MARERVMVQVWEDILFAYDMCEQPRKKCVGLSLYSCAFSMRIAEQCVLSYKRHLLVVFVYISTRTTNGSLYRERERESE